MSFLPLPARFRVIGLDLSSQQEVAHVFTTADWREAVAGARAAGALPLRISLLNHAGRSQRTWKLDLDGDIERGESLLLEHPVLSISFGIALFFAVAVAIGVLVRGF